MKKNTYKHLFLLIVMFFINSTIYSQKELIKVNDEFLISDKDIIDLQPKGSCDCEGDLIFTNTSLDAFYNSSLIESINESLRKDWIEKQNIIVKESLSKLFNEPFASYDAARNKMFIESESNIVNNISFNLKNTYNNTLNTVKVKSDINIKELKLLQLREAEIKSGNLNNPEFGFIKIDGIFLKDIKDLNALSQKWSQIEPILINNLSSQNSLTNTLKNLTGIANSDETIRGLFDNFLLTQKINYSNSFKDWERLNLIQFIIYNYKWKKEHNNYIEIAPYYFDKYKNFNSFFKVNQQYIENYAIYTNINVNPSVYTDAYFQNLLAVASRNSNNYVDRYDMYSEVDQQWEDEKEQAIKNLLNTVDVSNFAIENAQNELENLTQDIPWKASSGKIKNLNNLEYNQSYVNGNAPAHFKLLDGSHVVASFGPLKMSTLGDTFESKFRDNIGFDQNERYYYINPAGTDQWSILLFDIKDLKRELELMFFLGAKELGQIIGTYVIPVEDIKILINGKDFAGQPSSRWLAAGMLLVEVVPGGKVFKGVGRATIKGLTKWSKIIIWGGKEFILKYEIINGLVQFGNRSQLAEILKTSSNIEAHHIIPWVKGGAHPVVQKAAKDGLFHLNMVANGLGLEKFTKLIGTGLHGNHPAYDTYVVTELNKFMSAYPSFNADDAFNFISNVLIPDLKNKIILAKNSGLNLNEYFKRFL